MTTALFERDLLYPTDNIIEPGIIHVKILNPDNSQMPVIVEPKSNHSAVENIDTVLDVMQKDIFDRIKIKISENTVVYIIPNDSDKQKFGDVKYLEVIFNDDGKFTFKASDIDI